MRKILAFLLILFIGISVFGFISMHHDMSHSNTGCAPFSMGFGLCPLGLIDMAIHHIAAFQEFSSFSVAFSNAVHDILYSFLLLVILYFIIKNLLPDQLNRQNRTQKLYAHKNIAFNIYVIKTMRYLALLENSPSLLNGI